MQSDNQEERIEELRRYSERLIESGRPGKFKKKIILQGIENLEKDNQYVYLPNHTSHFDDVLVPALLKKGYPCPVPVAGKNLDVWPINAMVPLAKWAPLLVDRRVFENGTRKARVEHKDKLEESVKKILIDGSSLLLFIEGGRRNPRDMMRETTTGLLGCILNTMQDEKMNSREIYGVNTAIHYDKIIEASFLPAMRGMVNASKKLKLPAFGTLAYYSLDLAAYLSRYLLTSLGNNPGNMYIRFGKPYPLSEFAVMKRVDVPPKRKLADRAASGICMLYYSLVNDCKNNNLRGTSEISL
jgi:glycerol-3-phosphate O-acyltransferase